MAINSKSLLKSVAKSGKLSPQKMAVELAAKPLKELAKINAILLAALAMWMAALGKAAMTGFIIGAGIGGVAGAGFGAYMGLQIALATGPFAPITGLVTIPLGAAVGGTTGALVGGLFGGLIAAGIYSGSTTLVSMGVGAGVGGAAGAYIGGSLGAGLGTLAVLGCAALTAGTCLFLAPIIPVMTLTGAAIGAVVGAAIGTATGYVLGKYILTPSQGFINGAYNAITSGAEKGAVGAASGTVGFFNSVINTIGNGIATGASYAGSFATGVASGAFSLITGATNFSVLGLGAATTAVAIATPVGLLVGGTVAGFTVLHHLNVINTASSFFSPERDRVIATTVQKPGDVPGGPTDPNCPYGWPTDHGSITQGPEGPASHSRLQNPDEQAIDIGQPLVRGESTYATFDGIVTMVIRTDDGTNFGRYIDITGNCDGKQFIAKWAHLLEVEFNITNGTIIKSGQLLGTIDNSGYSLGDHLHYSFDGIPMAEPYIPQTPTPPECELFTSSPCNISWTERTPQ